MCEKIILTLLIFILPLQFILGNVRSDKQNTDSKTDDLQNKKYESYSNIIENVLIPHLEYYFNKTYLEKSDLKIDGITAFTELDRFVGGKVINAYSYILCSTEKNSELFEKRIQMFNEILNLVLESNHYETWSHLYSLIGLYRLQQDGLLSHAVSEKNLSLLKSRLDWRSFVDSTNFNLINKPTNYLNVAAGIAKYRELLGWENNIYSKQILTKIIDHIKDYSGENLYMDDTRGDGRFDRYTILIPAELCAQLRNTNEEIPDMLLKMLRRSCEIVLNLANEEGDGIFYGRSIGAYGDLAPLMILSIGAELGLLKEDEKELAFWYSSKIVKKFVNFWIDPEMKSLNLWEKGRRTDEYRNKNRILGENLSTSMLVINSYEEWLSAGYDTFPTIDFKKVLQKLPAFKYYEFTKERGLAIIRDLENVFVLPLISGGKYYYNTTPYLPVPNKSLLFETPPDSKFNFLVPKITLEDNTQLMPIVYFKNISFEQENGNYILSYYMDGLCNIDGENPKIDSSFACSTKFTFSQNSIVREDLILSKSNILVKEVSMEFLSFSKNPSVSSEKVTFSEGNVREIEVQGYDDLKILNVQNNKDFFTPNGMLSNQLIYKKINFETDGGFKVNWKIKY